MIYSRFVKAAFSSALLLRICDDEAYRQRCSTVGKLMRQRARNVLSSLTRDAERHSTSSAVAIRGSYARLTPDIYSDLDVIVIARSATEDRGLLSIERHLSGSGVSCLSYFLDRVSFKINLQAYWQSLDCVRFLWGMRDTYLGFTAMVRGQLQSTSFEQLLHLYSFELKTIMLCPNESAHFRDMKRGQGGQVELEFISVLRHWQNLQGRPLSSSQKKIVQSLRRYQRHLAILKAYVRSIVRTNTDSRAFLADDSPMEVPWFFSNDISDELALEHHDMAMIFIGLVPETLGS